MIIKLGDWVRCKRACDFVYQDDYKIIEYYDLDETYTCVIGLKKKATGKYIGSKRRFSFDGGDYIPPYLRVNKYYWVYKCRSTLKGNSFYVMPEDVENE